MNDRKRVFIIHGRGYQNGLGRESGGDLDTVASNAFYAVWAQNHLKDVLGRTPVYGQDYAFDFVNYSEGLFHLVVHRGSDIHLPDFPIDALAPRIRMFAISQKSAIGELSEFARLFTEFRRWIVGYVDILPREITAIANEIFKQYTKVVEHRDAAAIRSANLVVCLFYNLAYLNAAAKTIAAPPVAEKVEELTRQTVKTAAGEEVERLKRRLSDLMDSRLKQDLIDKVLAAEFPPAVERSHILTLLRAVEEDMTAKGRIDHADDLMIVTVEAAAYIIRGARLAAAFPIKELDRKTSEKIASELDAVSRTLQMFFAALSGSIDGIELSGGNEGAETALANVKTCLRSLAEIAVEIRTPALPETSEGLIPIRLMVTYEASGIAVSNIEIVVRRLAGDGPFLLSDGTEYPGAEIILPTDRDGTIELYYRPAAPDEPYRVSATFDDIIHAYFPPETGPNSDDAGDCVEEEMELDTSAGMDRATKVSVDLIERQIKFLNDHDVRIAAIDDHHPYTPAILGKLQELMAGGYIGAITLSSLPRGQHQPVEDLKCGADLIYEQYIEGNPWDNPGLKKLRDIAHGQDLALARHDLAIQLSKLIGLKHRKIDLVMKLARHIEDVESLDRIMEQFNWTAELSSFERKVDQSIPRVDEAVGQIVLERDASGDDSQSGADGGGGRLHILAALSPLSDPKKGEPQINLATAMGYLMRGKKYHADYFFYCYGSSMLQMRNVNKQDESMDLSLLARRLGTPGDGGHHGAATCRPGLNPSFPQRLFSKINELNFLQYLDYLGSRISRATGMRLIGVQPPADMTPTDQQLECLQRVVAGSRILELVHQKSGSGPVTVMVVRAPVTSTRTPIGYLQVYRHVRSRADVHYLMYCQPGLNSIVIQNVNDPSMVLNPGRLAKAFGWPEDGGTDLAGIASGRLNKYIKPEFRWLKDEDFPRLCSLFGLIFEHRTDYRVKSYTRPA